MSPSSWRKRMALALTPHSKDNHKPRLAIVGVGSEQNGDDGAGPFFIQYLSKFPFEDESILLIDGGPAPENFTGALRRFQPDMVLLVDATWMDKPAGFVDLFDWQQISGFSGSTHGLPLSLLSGYLQEELGCSVRLLAIQPKQTEWGGSICPEVLQAVEQTADALRELILC